MPLWAFVIDVDQEAMESGFEGLTALHDMFPENANFSIIAEEAMDVLLRVYDDYVLPILQQVHKPMSIRLGELGHLFLVEAADSGDSFLSDAVANGHLSDALTNSENPEYDAGIAETFYHAFHAHYVSVFNALIHVFSLSMAAIPLEVRQRYCANPYGVTCTYNPTTPHTYFTLWGPAS